MVSASLEPVSRGPPTFILRLHDESAGDWETRSPYFGSATVTFYGVIAVVRGLTVPDRYSRAVKTAIKRAVKREGARAVIGTHGDDCSLLVWAVA